MLLFQFILCWTIFWTSETGKKIADASIAVTKVLAISLITLGVFSIALPVAIQKDFPTTLLATITVLFFLVTTYVIMRTQHSENPIVLKGFMVAITFVGACALFQEYFALTAFEAAIVKAEFSGVTVFKGLETAISYLTKKETAPAAG